MPERSSRTQDSVVVDVAEAEKDRTEEEPLVQRQRSGRWCSEIASCGARLGPHVQSTDTVEATGVGCAS